ncbi:hypothetical protein ACFL2V_10595 [Pseudomonadota bacterium]
MPRRAHLSMPSVLLHIIQRGNNRSACFFSEEDYHFYLDALKDQAEKRILMTRRETLRTVT